MVIEVTLPARAEAETEWLERTTLPAKPAEVTRNASILPKPASAPSVLVMPGTASAASSAAAARATSCSVVGSAGSSRSSAAGSGGAAVSARPA
jgi:hypothetical protein